MDKIKGISVATGATVFCVAAFAAVVSYSHGYHLALDNHQLGLDALLLPLSVDGVMIASSLVLLLAALRKLSPLRLTRVTLWVGITATVAMNMAYGHVNARLGLVLSAWPAVALILVVESVMELFKAQRVKTRKQETGKDRIRNAVAHEAKALNEQRVEFNPPIAGALAPLPTIAEIRDQLKCGQPKATDIKRIMRTEVCDLNAAVKIREEEKRRG